MDFFNSLSPHPWLQAIVFWDFPLANSFGRALPAGFQLVRLCAVRVGAARPGCGFPDGIPLLSICMGTTSPLCTHVSSTGYQEGKVCLCCSWPVVWPLSPEHPALEGKGRGWSCFKHLISRAVAKTFDHFPSEWGNSQDCIALIFHGKGKIMRFDVSFLEQNAWSFWNVLCIFYLLFLYLKYF